jgi:hypothetical protein
LVVTLTPSSSYTIASGPAQTEIHDGEHGIIDTGFSAEWEDEDAWKTVPQDDMLWDDVTHRWRANIPSQLVGLVGMVTWYRRPHDNPLEPWQEFAGSEYSPSAVEYLATGYPGVGHWDIMYRATYGLLSWFQAEEYDWAGNGIAGVSWGRGDPAQKMRNLGNEIEVFPEIVWDVGVCNEVEVHVVLLASVPAGKSAQVKLKVFDPDHPHTPTAEEAWWPSIQSFDPNDVYDTSEPPEEAITLEPKDNRKSAGGLVGDDAGGTLLPDVLTFPGSGNPFDPPSFHQFTRFRIDEPQPGNNFVAVAGPVRPAEAENLVEKVYFAQDAVSLMYMTHGLGMTLPGRYQSITLTVWRTLWVELDSMTAPTDVVAQGPFDQPNLPTGIPDPQYDQNLGDLPNGPIDLLAPNFAPAKIEVQVLPASIDDTDERFFFHYIHEAPGGPTSQAHEVRDLVNDSLFWIVHVIGAYEGQSTVDFDPDQESEPALGEAISGTNIAYVYFEEIRDRSDFPGNSAFPATVEQAKLQKRTVLHEVGHVMGAPHNITPLGGIMNGNSKFADWTDGQAVYTVAQFGIFQAKLKPQWDSP